MSSLFPEGSERVGSAYVMLRANGLLVPKDIRDSLEKADPEVEKAGDRHGKKYTSAYGKRLDDLRRKIDSVFDHAEQRIGKAFGRGSRNDLLNFIGVIGQGLSKLILAPFRLIADLGVEFMKGFKAAGGGLSGLTGGFKALAPVVGKTVLGLAALAVVIGGVVAGLSPLIAGVSLLLGGMTALAGTIGFALVGALGALAGILVPVVAGIGVLALGIAGLNDKMKKDLMQTTKGLRQEFRELSEVAAKGLFSDIERQSTLAERVLKNFRPLIRNVSEAIAEVGTSWLDALDSPGFREFQRTMVGFLPNAIRDLGDIVENTFSGLGGLFEGMIPLVQKFLGWLEKITGEFAKWANTEAGQAEIREFFRDAVDSVKALGGFLESAWNLLKLLLNEGKGTGDSLFKSLGDNIQRFVDYLKANPDALENWFRDSKDFMESLGTALVQVGHFLDMLDSPTARKVISQIGEVFTGIATGVDAMSRALETVNGWLGTLWGWLEKIAGWVKENNPISLLAGQISDLAETIGNLDLSGLGTGGIGALAIKFKKPNLAAIAEDFAPLAGKILAKIAPIDLLSKFRNPVSTVIGWFTGISGKILGKFSAINFLSKFNNPVGSITGWFVGISGKILMRFAQINFLSKFVNPVAAIVGWFTGLAGKILDRIGNIVITPSINMPSIPRPSIDVGGHGIPGLPGPLDPLDRSVPFAPSTTGTSGKVVNASGWTIVSPGADPRAVATQVLNQLVATAYV